MLHVIVNVDRVDPLEDGARWAVLADVEYEGVMDGPGGSSPSQKADSCYSQVCPLVT